MKISNMRNNFSLLITIILLSSTISIAQAQQLHLSGTAHWINSSGISFYSSEAILDVIQNGNIINLTGPINISSKEGILIASFNLSLNGTKIGNKLVFDDQNSFAKVLETSTGEIVVGEKLFVPGWDGQWTRNNRVKLDGDIYRQTPYLDILLSLHGTYS
jgi:hypothetical protein